MNDSRMLNDPQMAETLEPVRKIHAIRLMIQDETAGMNAVERTAYYHEGAAALFASMGLAPPKYVNLSGQGKVK